MVAAVESWEIQSPLQSGIDDVSVLSRKEGW
jgi:hypothetical protein